MAALQSTTGRDQNGVINSPNPSAGIYELDIEIVSTLATDLNIELFNPESSQFDIINASINDYVPLAGFALEKSDLAAGADASFSMNGATADEQYGGVLMGSKTIFVNAAGFVPLGTTPNVCFFDENGDAIYQPGYKNGVKTAGTVRITATQNNVTYRHIMKWAARNDFDFHSTKAEFSENAQIKNSLNFVKTDVFGSRNVVQVTMKNAKQNTQYNPLLLDLNVGQRVTPNVGINYNMSASGTGTQTVTFNIYMSVISKLTSIVNGKPTRPYAQNAD